MPHQSAASLACVRPNCTRGDILLQIFPPLRPRNRDNVRTLRQHPGQRQLRSRALFLASYVFHAPHQIQILLKILSLKPRRISPVIIRWQIVKLLELPR